MLKIFRKIYHTLRKNYFSIKYSNTISKSCVIGKKADLSHCILDEESRIAHHASITHSKIGKLSSIGRYTKITHTEIGSYCAVSWDVTINALNHPFTHLTVSAFPYVPYVGNFVKIRQQEYQKVIIGNDVWIGANSVIMPGVIIGNGAIIGAGAVVTKNVPDYAIVVGVPAKIIKYRFDEDIIQQLLNIQWWNFEKEKIKQNIDLFQGDFTNDKLKKLGLLAESDRNLL